MLKIFKQKIRQAMMAKCYADMPDCPRHARGRLTASMEVAQAD